MPLLETKHIKIQLSWRFLPCYILVQTPFSPINRSHIIHRQANLFQIQWVLQNEILLLVDRFKFFMFIIMAQSSWTDHGQYIWPSLTVCPLTFLAWLAAALVPCYELPWVEESLSLSLFSHSPCLSSWVCLSPLSPQTDAASPPAPPDCWSWTNTNSVSISNYAVFISDNEASQVKWWKCHSLISVQWSQNNFSCIIILPHI